MVRQIEIEKIIFATLLICPVIVLFFLINVSEDIQDFGLKKLKISLLNDEEDDVDIIRPSLNRKPKFIGEPDAQQFDMRLAIDDDEFIVENNSSETNFALSTMPNYDYYFTNPVLPKVFKTLEDISQNLKNHGLVIDTGGMSSSVKNSKCRSKTNLAIIIAYRDRLLNLKVFLNNMHQFLTKQKLNYGIYLVEPEANLTFNRALLMNIGFVESIRNQQFYINSAQDEKWNCFIFHDIDMLPQDIRNTYRCDEECPLHLATARDSKNYSTDGYQQQYFGGVTAMTKRQFQTVNGFSNLFFGWGKEDDNLYRRSIFKFGKIKKLPAEIGRYHSASHDLQERNDERDTIHLKLLKEWRKRGIHEGLSTLKYTLREVKKHDLYTHIRVYYDQKNILENYFNSSLWHV